jgi:hypothetical protein
VTGNVAPGQGLTGLREGIGQFLGLAGLHRDPFRLVVASRGGPGPPEGRLLPIPGTLPHPVGGLIVLLVILVLNVFKPQGLTPYGWRIQQTQRLQPPDHDVGLA